jgi:hypothetical protein
MKSEPNKELSAIATILVVIAVLLAYWMFKTGAF